MASSSQCISCIRMLSTRQSAVLTRSYHGDIFSRREKKKLRALYPRPDKQRTALYPPVPAIFESKITLADGSYFYLPTTSPRSTMTLVKDITNHPLWNPSLARETAQLDESGRASRFARRFAKLDEKVVSPTASQSPATATATDSTAAAATASSTDSPGSSIESTTEKSTKPVQGGMVQGFTEDDFEWMSGESIQSVSGMGDTKHIRGMNKKPKGKK